MDKSALPSFQVNETHTFRRLHGAQARVDRFLARNREGVTASEDEAALGAFGYEHSIRLLQHREHMGRTSSHLT